MFWSAAYQRIHIYRSLCVSGTICPPAISPAHYSSRLLVCSLPKKTWHTLQERRIIKKHGGKDLVKYGYDGKINGRPVEVRSVKKDNRYRIQKNVHQTLVANGGSYIFVNRNGESKKVSAKQVSKKLGRGRWFKDRRYPHRFLKVTQCSDCYRTLDILVIEKKGFGRRHVAPAPVGTQWLAWQGRHNTHLHRDTPLWSTM